MSDAILKLSEHSIKAARAVDPVHHDFLLQTFQKSEGGDDILQGKNLSEVFTSLGVSRLVNISSRRFDSAVS